MLSPWSLSRSRALKKVLWVLKEARSFREASLVHATSALEETELRVLGLGAPIAVVSNGVDTEGEYAASRVADARSSVDSGARRRILFLSRLHPKKGLDLLQQAWSTLPPNLAVELVIAGHGEAGAISAVEHWTASQAGPPARYVGLLVGDEKVKALASAFLLVLPSRSENYGMAVAEALAAGTPVITTTATPWMDLADRGCGWTIEPTLEALTETLSRALAIEDHTHARMRHHARIFIEDNHSLTVMASQFEALYGTLAERVS
jgi:glycosyltransferase involved in cell wall biosynthesis